MEMLQQTFVLTYIFMRLILLYLYHTIRKTNGQICVLRAINECPNDKVKENGGRNYFFLSCYFFFLPQVLLCALRSTDVIWFASAISPAVAAAAVALPSRGFLAALLEHLQKLYRTLTSSKLYILLWFWRMATQNLSKSTCVYLAFLVHTKIL